jgi:hypothetical protein
MAAAIEAHQPQTVPQRCDLRIPHLEVERPSVKQDEAGAMAFVPKTQAAAGNVQIGFADDECRR